MLQKPYTTGTNSTIYLDRFVSTGTGNRKVTTGQSNYAKRMIGSNSSK